MILSISLLHRLTRVSPIPHVPCPYMSNNTQLFLCFGTSSKALDSYREHVSVSCDEL